MATLINRGSRFPTTLKIVPREQRIFRCYYVCDAPDCSPIGSEWVDEALVVTTGYCPCCDRAYEPVDFDEIIEERLEFVEAE